MGKVNVQTGQSIWDYEKFQSELYQKIIREMAKDVCQSITKSVIKMLQKNEADLLGDTGLKSMWEEVCLIVYEGDGEHYDSCIDTIDEMIAMVLDKKKFTQWQLTAIWLRTSGGIDWIYDENDKVPGIFPLICNDQDIVIYIRDEYVWPAADNWTNKRIRRYVDNQYEMDY